MSGEVTDHAFMAASPTELCKFPISASPKAPLTDVHDITRCAKPASLHALTPRSHSWLGRAADGGSNTPCLRSGCGEPRLAKVHHGHPPEHLSVRLGTCKTCKPGTDCPKWHHEADERCRPKDAETYYAITTTDEVLRKMGVPGIEEAEPLNLDDAIGVWDAYAARVRELLVQKSAYGNSWRKRGWNGNVTRVLTKADRLDSMLMRDMPTFDPSVAMDGSDKDPTFESVLDTLLDIGPLAAFAIRNIEEGNRWGH